MPADLAQLTKTIERMPDGIDTLVGERGLKLSGGQRQRLAIARGFLKNSSIIILDEATSALDSESEKMVQEAIDKNSFNRTIINVTHRLSSIRNYDLILVMKNKPLRASMGKTTVEIQKQLSLFVSRLQVGQLSHFIKI